LVGQAHIYEEPPLAIPSMMLSVEIRLISCRTFLLLSLRSSPEEFTFIGTQLLVSV